MSEEHGFQVADAEQVQTIIDQLAGKIFSEFGTNLHLIGIRRRGVPLMEKLQKQIAERSGASIPSNEIVLKRYADDLSILHNQPELKEDPELNVDGKHVVLVDDVLYTGRTMWKAINVVQGAGAKRTMTAVLCSRGENEVPIRADYNGLQLDVCEGNVIEVHIPPYEEDTGVWLFHQKELEA